MTHWVPELLLPAGDIERMKVAVLYGARAVYLSGQAFGLRFAAGNFTEVELTQAVEFAHARGVRVYVTLNSYLRDDDFLRLPEYLAFLNRLQVDAVIVSDIAVVDIINQCSNIPIHLSTQMSCLNSGAAAFWKKLGIKRIVLGREVSIVEAARIKKEVEIEVEMFIHGSMCFSYSGNCLLSYYTTGRDSNRGGCAHNCRFAYQSEDGAKYLLSSKDLNGIELLDKMIEYKIDSVKIEGRMKSYLYVGTVAKVYAELLRCYHQHGGCLNKAEWGEMLNHVVHRDYFSGHLQQLTRENTVFDKREGLSCAYRAIGPVLEANANHLIVEVRNAFALGDRLELLPFEGPAQEFVVSSITDIQGEPCRRTKPGTLVKLPALSSAQKWNLLRMRVL